MSWSFRLTCFFLMAVLAVGCGDSPPTDERPKHPPDGPRNKERPKKSSLDLADFRMNPVAAPKTEGKDADGKTLKLSDYKGKVVLLDFWAGWCPPCVAMIPHERALMKDYKDRRFALVGVNLDHTYVAFQEARKKHAVNWRSLWGGKGNVLGAWAVPSLPTVFLIDHKGMIRYRFDGVPGGDTEALDGAFRAAIDKLLKEVPEK